MALNQYEYNYITGAFYCSNVGKKYNPWGSSTSNYSWSVEFTSVKMSGAGYLAQNPDGDGDNWKVGVNSNRNPYIEWRSPSGRNTYTYTNLSVEWGSWFNIKYSIVTNGASPTVRCTVYSTSQDLTCTGRWTYNVDKSLTVGSSVTTIRDNVIIKGYPYSNTLATATFALDSMTRGATSVTVDGYTYSCPAIQHYSDPAPTVTLSLSSRTDTSLTIAASTNYTCNKWEYSINNGSSYTSYSTTSTTSTSYTITGLTKGTTYNVRVRATKVGSGYTGVSATGSYTTTDSTPPTVSASVTYTSATAVTLSASADYDCNKWEYQIGSGSWTTFSTTNGKSASASITVSSTSTVTVRATRTSNSVTGTKSVSVDRSAPTVTASASQTAETTVTLSVSANVNCNKWEYKVDSGSWVSFSTTNGTSASTSVSLTTGSSHTITARATKTANYVTNTASVTADKTAPTVSCSATDSAAGSVTLSASSNVNCNKWEYRVGSGSWTTFSSTNGTSASTTVSGLTAGTTGTITVRATKTANYVTATASASYDKTAPTISSASTSSVTANSCTLSASTNVNCNKWEYQVGSGSWTTFSTTNGKSASVSITGLSPATTYSINVRVTKTSNYVTATTSTSATTLGFSTITSVSNVNVDNKTTVTFTPLSTSFYFKVAFKLGATIYATENIGKPNQTTAYSYQSTYTFPASTLPSDTSGTWVCLLYTYSDSGYSNLVGSDYKTFTVTVPNTATYQPSVSLTLTPYNTNTWLNSKGLYVSGYTAINIAVSSSAGSGSSLTGTTVNPTSTTISTNNYRTAVINSTSQAVSVTVTDRRGRSKTATSTVSFNSYSSPSVSTFATERGTYSGGTWTSATDGNHIRATVTTSCSLSANGNTATATVRCVIGGTATAPNATSGNYYYWTGTTSETSYVVTVSVTDSVGNTTTFSSTVNAIAVPFNLNTHTPAAAFGKVAETTKGLEIAKDWRLKAYGKYNTMDYMPYSWSTYANSGTLCYVRIATVTVTGNYSTAPITFVTTRTGDTAPVVLHMAFPSENTTDPSTCYLRYNDVNGAYTANGEWSAFAVKLSTSTWGVYIWKPSSSGVVGVTTYLSAYTQGKVTVTYSDDSYTSIPSGAVMATQLPIINTAKKNTFAYLPYSAYISVASQAGYVRVASIEVIQSYASQVITLYIARRNDYSPTRLFIRFSNTSSTDPALLNFAYDMSAKPSSTVAFEAYMYKRSTSTWDVYVQKSENADLIDVWTMIGGYQQNHVNITYPNDQVTTVPSGATRATLLGTMAVKASLVTTSGYYAYYNQEIVATSRIVVTQLYRSGGTLGYFFVAQPFAGGVNIYVRNHDRTVPPDNTTIDVTISITN